MPYISYELRYFFKNNEWLEAKEKEEEMNKYKWKKRMTEWREFWRRILFPKVAEIIDWKIRNKK